MVLNLKQLFEEATDDRMVAVYSAWMITAMQQPDTARERLARFHKAATEPLGAAFMKLVDQYRHFLEPHRGLPQMIACNRTDADFSEFKAWRSLASFGVQFQEDPRIEVAGKRRERSQEKRSG